jgi:hypothetical protein
MEDKRSIKKVVESQGDMHEKVENQSNSELSSSSLTRSPLPPHIQIDVQIAYNQSLGRSTYAQKAKGITSSMALVSCPTKIEVLCYHFGPWAMYPVGVHSGCVLGFSHDPRTFIFSSRHHFT